MKSILLIGLGRFGKYIAKKLNDLNHEVMAIDTDEDRVNSILPFVTNAQIGDSTNEELLQFIKQHAIIFESQGVDAHSNILALSTCQSAENVERMLVFGTLTPAT